MRSFYLNQNSQAENYRLLTSVVIPRPIAIVSTIGADKILNLAPFSSFNLISSDPACVLFSVARKEDHSKKQTLINIEAIGEFVINIPNLALLDIVEKASRGLNGSVDSFGSNEITPLASKVVSVPRVGEAPIQIECKLEKLVEVGEEKFGGSTIVIGRVLIVHIDNNYLTNDTVQSSSTFPLARMGAREYAVMGERIYIGRK